MEEWHDLQQREQALTDQHRSAQQALQHDFMRKHDALERQFERDRQAIETSKAQCMARMAAQAAASAVGRSDGSALLQWPAAPAATAALSWTHIGTPLPAASGLRSLSLLTANSHSDAATVPVSSQDASQELMSEAASQGDDDDDIISGIESDSDSDASGISLSEPRGRQPSLQAAVAPSNQQANSQPRAEQLQSSQHLPADEQAATAHAAADAAASIGSPDSAEHVKSPAQSMQSPAAKLPAALPATAMPAEANPPADETAAGGSLQIAVSQPGPPLAGRAKRVQPTRVGDALAQPSQPAASAAAAAADRTTAADADASTAAGPAPDGTTAASPRRQTALAPAENSEVLALLRGRAPGDCPQFLTNMPELAWPLSRAKVHRLYALPLPRDIPCSICCVEFCLDHMHAVCACGMYIIRQMHTQQHAENIGTGLKALQCMQLEGVWHAAPCAKGLGRGARLPAAACLPAGAPAYNGPGTRAAEVIALTTRCCCQSSGHMRCAVAIC
jgi:hypothetical protein